MIGDLRLLIARLFKQHVTCKHDYKHAQMKAYPFDLYLECKKCGKTKDWS